MSLFKPLRINILSENIDKEAFRLLTSLTQDEQIILEQNILTDGRIFDPFVVWVNTATQKCYLVDGYYRYLTLINNPDSKIPYFVNEILYEDEEEVKEWLFNHHLGRRHATK